MGEHIHGVGQCETEKRERADWCRMTFPVLPLPANTMGSRTTGQRSHRHRKDGGSEEVKQGSNASPNYSLLQ